MRVPATARQEFEVGALFHDPTAVEDNDTVREARGRQTVCDDQSRASHSGPL